MVAFNGADITIRPMQLEDIQTVHQIDVRSFSLPWPERSYRFELTENPASRCWVAEVKTPENQKQIAGMLVMWQIIDEAHIGTLATDPDFRQRGVARRMLAHALSQAAGEGIQKVYLEVRRNNIAAQALYKGFGFQVSSIRRHYYPDTGEDALLMTLETIHLDFLDQMVE
ncbi:MAG TPA: ribosomal protein S18-alanine N-acetyltransferase [Anaerolineaceae bacterium]|nr:ribosomal protein S18-alanine N-acetyltransferase [Anaerolineaceae bacterium]